jgi:FRG domain
MNSGKFFQRLRAVQHKCDPHGQGAWYRGLKKSSYQLVPSYLRYERLRGKEHNLMARFTRQGARFLDTKDKWERLAFMQHYGVPTKLMDWSANVTAAIYFALAFRVKTKEDLDNPCIWVLNPFRLNEFGSHNRKIYDNMDEPPDLKLERQKSNEWQHELPIAIALDWRNTRIEHQQGGYISRERRQTAERTRPGLRGENRYRRRRDRRSYRSFEECGRHALSDAARPR